MPVNDNQRTIHNVTVQQAPPSYQSPRKKLSHSVKAIPSAFSSGNFVGIPVRARKRRRRWWR